MLRLIFSVWFSACGGGGGGGRGEEEVEEARFIINQTNTSRQPMPFSLKKTDFQGSKKNERGERKPSCISHEKLFNRK